MDFRMVQAFWRLHEVQRNGVGDSRKNDTHPNTHTHVYTCEDTDVCTCTPMNTGIHKHTGVQHTPEHTGVFLSTAPEGSGCSGGKDSVINWVWDTWHPPFLAESQSAAVTVSLKNLALKSPFPSAFLHRPRPRGPWGLWGCCPGAVDASPHAQHWGRPSPSLRTSSPRSHVASRWGMLLGKSPSFPLRRRAGANEGWAFTPVAAALASHALLFGVDPTHEGVGFLMAWILC